MNTTRLYLEGIEVELDESVQFVLNKQFEDLSNPTTIINDWSKTISIPFTESNNNLFGHIYNVDRVTIESDVNNWGIYFNPTKRIDFRLDWNNNVLMQGYAKLNEIKQTYGKGTYEITLYGALGKIFQEMKKITFDTATEDTNYLIDGEKYVAEYINKDLIYQSWTSQGQLSEELLTTNDANYKVTDIIGFAPNNSFSEGFDYKTYQTQEWESNQFTTVLGDTFKEYTGVEPSSAIPNGMLPREIGEYRSYLQLPYIYFNKLFQIFQAKSEELTGYKFDLDESWFNSSNPYWYNLVYMLSDFGQRLKNEEIKKNTYTPMFRDTMKWDETPTTDIKGQQLTFRYSLSQEVLPILLENPTSSLSNTFQLSKDYSVGIHTPIAFKMRFPAYYKPYPTRESLHLSPNNAFELTIEAVGSNNYRRQWVILVCDEDFQVTGDFYYKIIKMSGENRNAVHENDVYDVFNIEFDFHTILSYFNFGETVSFMCWGQWLNTNYSFMDSHNAAYIPSSGYEQTLSVLNDPFHIDILLQNHRSNTYFTLNDLWDNNYNLFNEIINYCKIYRITVNVDNLNKKIIFKPANKYFQDYMVHNWNDKLNLAKDFTIKPVSFENKYITFNYKDLNNKINTQYKENYGANYGEYRIITDYNFNNENKNLFENITPSIVNTDNVLSWTNLFDNHTIAYSLPAEIYVYNKDKDNKQTGVFGAYYFFNGLSNFSTEESLHLRSVCLSDDTLFQQSTVSYFYTQDADTTLDVTTYPKLDIVRDDKLCVFNVPKENYTYLNNYSDKLSIYKLFWEDYINERYNINNKLVTCYINLKPHDFYFFNWNNFISINNQLYIVNKIYDYNLSSNESTKVDLLTIQDINGYTNNN